MSKIETGRETESEFEYGVFTDDDIDMLKRFVGREIEGGSFSDEDYLVEVEIENKEITWPQRGSRTRLGGVAGILESYGQVDTDDDELSGMFDVVFNPGEPVMDDQLPEECRVQRDGDGIAPEGKVGCVFVDGDDISSF